MICFVLIMKREVTDVAFQRNVGKEASLLLLEARSYYEYFFHT